MSRPSRLALLALLAGAGGCSDRADPGPTSPSEEQAIAIAPSPDAKGTGAQRAAEERLARRVALALADPDFRSYVKGRLDGSTVLEHKLHFQRWLRSSDHRLLKALAKASEESEALVNADADVAAALEFYMPVPAHRAVWQGGEDVLVATAREDHERPIAFDTRGKRQVFERRRTTDHAGAGHRAGGDRLRRAAPGKPAARGWRRWWRRRRWRGHTGAQPDPGAVPDRRRTSSRILRVG